MQHLVFLDEIENGNSAYTPKGCFNREHFSIGSHQPKQWNNMCKPTFNFSEKNLSYSNKSCSVSEHIIIIIATLTKFFLNTVNS